MDTTTYRVAMEDGTGYEVVSDQRDIARWEIQPFGTPWNEAPSRLFTYSRFRAWNAGRRTKAHTLSWDEFDERCVEVTAVEEAEPPDPGQPAASAESS